MNPRCSRGLEASENVSSNWSTTMTRWAPSDRLATRVAEASSALTSSASSSADGAELPSIRSSCAAKAVSGAGPGVTTATATGPAARNAGISPARTRELLPLPEAPSTARKRLVRSFAASSAVSRSRPKKSSASSSWNASRPRYGHTSSAIGRARPTGPASTARNRSTTAWGSSIPERRSTNGRLAKNDNPASKGSGAPGNNTETSMKRGSIATMSLAPARIWRAHSARSRRPTSSRHARADHNSSVTSPPANRTSSPCPQRRSARVFAVSVSRASWQINTSDRAARAAAASSPVEANRSSGRLAIAFRTTSSSLVGRPGTRSLALGGGSVKCAITLASNPVDANGTRPVSAWNSTHPNAYTSVRASTAAPRICSGERYAGVPAYRPSPGVCVWAIGTESPKSVRETCSSPEASATRMLPGLTSRWTSPCACAASRASATCETMRTAAPTGNRPRRWISSCSDAPSTNRIAMYKSPSSSPLR